MIPELQLLNFSAWLVAATVLSCIHPVDSSRRQEPGTMQAVQFTPGGPENMSIGSVPIPEPKDGEVRIKVLCTAINRADTLQRRGFYPPPPGASDILGLEAAGVIDKIGSGCPPELAVGQRVMALLAGGGNAEYVCSPWQQVMVIPEQFSVEQAAAVPEVWLTAYQLLYKVGQLSEGDTVLIHAGGSGVGTAAVQLVRQAGATAIVTAGSQEKIELARSLGATAGINYKEESVGDRLLELTSGKGADLILDCVGASMWEANVKAVAMDGRWIVYGLLGGPTSNVNLGALLRKRVQMLFSTLRTRSLQYKASLVKDFSDLALPLFADGTFKPIVQTVLPLSEIGKAHALMEANTTQGKIVLRVQEDGSAKDEL